MFGLQLEKFAACIPMQIQRIKATWMQEQGSWSVGKIYFASNVILQWIPKHALEDLILVWFMIKSDM